MASKKEITKKNVSPVKKTNTSKKNAKPAKKTVSAVKTSTKKAVNKAAIKKGVNKTATKKVTSNDLKKLNKLEFFKEKLLSPTVVCVVLIVFLLILVIINGDKIVITIDNVRYTEKDFNMYAYLVKSEYFGYEGTELSESTLNTQVSNDSEITIREYLKEQTINKLKVSAAIQRIAKENNIVLEKTDDEEIEQEKNDFISELGGISKFREILRKNNTNEESFLEAARSEKLFKKIFDELYSEGKRYDLTEEELNGAKKSYYDDYVKIKQVIILKKDLSSNQFYDDVTLNQKEILANEISRLGKTGTNFDTLIKKYSETLSGDVVSEYYLKKDLNDDLESAINSLRVGDISGVVSSDYAYHIVLMEKLDDAKLNDYFDSKRELKLMLNVADNLNKIAIINSDYLNEITVK